MKWLRQKFTNMSQDMQFFIGALIAIPLILFVLSALYGCAAVFDSNWHQTEAPSAIPYSIVYIDPKLIPTACGVECLACTIRSQRIIYLPEGAPAWLLAHELRHQNGESHL